MYIHSMNQLIIFSRSPSSESPPPRQVKLGGFGLEPFQTGIVLGKPVGTFITSIRLIFQQHCNQIISVGGHCFAIISVRESSMG